MCSCTDVQIPLCTWFRSRMHLELPGKKQSCQPSLEHGLFRNVPFTLAKTFCCPVQDTCRLSGLANQKVLVIWSNVEYPNYPCISRTRTQDALLSTFQFGTKTITRVITVSSFLLRRFCVAWVVQMRKLQEDVWRKNFLQISRSTKQDQKWRPSSSSRFSQNGMQNGRWQTTNLETHDTTLSLERLHVAKKSWIKLRCILLGGNSFVEQGLSDCFDKYLPKPERTSKLYCKRRARPRAGWQTIPLEKLGVTGAGNVSKVAATDCTNSANCTWVTTRMLANICELRETRK